MPAVKARIRAAWKKTHSDADPEDMPAILKEGVADKMDATHLLEYVANTGVKLNINRDKGVIYGVKVLGLESQNNRIYTVEAVTKAKHLYEGKPVNIDHLDGKARRSYRDRIGRLVNIRVGGDGLYGDMIVNPRHPLAEQLFWDAENCPENVGLSHDAQGKTRVANGKMIVESIDFVRSIDLVAEPATTRSLYEGKESGNDAAAGAAVADQDAEPDADKEKKTLPKLSDVAKPGYLDDTGTEDDSDIDVDSLPDDAFAIVLPGGVKIRNRTYPLHKRYFPIHTPAAIKRSLQAIKNNKKLSEHHKQLAWQRIVQAARAAGIPVYESLQKECDMDLNSLTVEQLKEARPDLVAEIQASSAVEAELIALKKERDELAAKLREAQISQELQAVVQEIGLSVGDIPQTIRESIVKEADDARRQALINDLKQLLASRVAGNVTVPKSSRPQQFNLPGTFEERSRLWK